MSARDKFIALTAGFWREHTDTWMCTGEHIEIFADLIRSDEREACAKVCEDMQSGWPSDDHLACAAAIRARGNT